MLDIRLDAEPISTYGQALSWLWTRSNPEDWIFEGEEIQLPLEAQAICLIFWKREQCLRRDMRKLWYDAFGVCPRTRHNVGGRRRV